MMRDADGGFSVRGCVYFIQAHPGGAIKIGRTTNLAKRLKQLQGAHAYPLKVMAYVDEGVFDEGDLHRRFASARLLGEWFRPTSGLLRFIESVSGDKERQQEVADIFHMVQLDRDIPGFHAER